MDLKNPLIDFKKIQQIKNLLICLFIVSIISNSYSQVIENLDFVQEGKNIRITYDLIGTEIAQQFDVEVYFSIDGGKTWEGPLKEITGNVGPNQTAGRNQNIFWDVLAEEKSLVGEVQFKIEARIIDDKSEKSEMLKDTPARRGFIGFSIGAGIPIRAFADDDFALGSGFAKTGPVINLINFGYCITNNLGVAANLSGGVFSIGCEVQKYGVLMAGPLVTFPGTYFDMNIRGMIGLMIGESPQIFADSIGQELIYYEISPTFVIDLGTSIRFYVSKKTSILINVDYMYGKRKFDSDYGMGENVVKFQAINVSGGIAFRLK